MSSKSVISITKQYTRNLRLDKVESKNHPLGRVPARFSILQRMFLVICLASSGTLLAAGVPPSGKPEIPAAVAPQKKKPSSKPVFYSLQGYIKAVLGQDSGLIATRLAQLSNQNEVKSTRAAYLPQVSMHADLGIVDGNTSFQYFRATTQPEKVHIPGVKGTTTVSVPVEFKTINFGEFDSFGPSVTMPFFKDGTFLGINTPPAVNIKRAEGQVLAAKARVDQQEVIFRATDLYLRAISTGDQAMILRQHLELVRKQTDIIHERAKYGLVSPADVTVADTKFEQSKVELVDATQLAISSFFRVAEFVGLEEPSLLRIDTKYPEPQPIPSFDGEALRTNYDHPEIQAQIAQADKANAEAALKRSQLWPSGTIQSSYRWGNDYVEPYQDRWLSLLSLQAPIFDFGDRYFAAKAAEKKYEEEKVAVAKVHDDVRQAIFETLTHLTNVRQHEASDTILLAERQRIADRLNELAKFEMVPVPQLLQAQIDLLEAKRVYEEDKLQVMLNSADLEKVSAGEWKWTKQAE
jgi:outer membrane protein TolC